MSHCPRCTGEYVYSTEHHALIKTTSPCPGCGHDGEIGALKAALARVQALPTQEWAEVCAVIMSVLADAARAGYPVRETDAVAAMDRGQTYVAMMKAELEKSQAGNRVLQRELTKVAEYFGMPGDGRLLSEQWIEAYEKVNKERDRANEIAENVREAFRKGFYAAMIDCRECPNSGSF